MRVQFLQFLALFKQLFVVFGGSLGELGPAFLDYCFVLGLQEDHDGVVLGVVQFVHVVWGHVQQTVLPLVKQDKSH